MLTSERFIIDGMHCAACAQKVSAALKQVPGVVEASASLTPPEALIVTHEPIPLSTLNAAVAEAGPYRLRDPQDQVRPMPSADTSNATQNASIYPLVLIVAYLAGAVLIIEAAAGSFALHRAMRHFMAGFFLVFSFFKLLDLRGFADAYRSYDVIAKKLPAWGMLYPFVELVLGIAYLAGHRLVLTNLVTLAIMLLGSVGVFQALRNKQAIRCACLGTVLNLPMTTVTLVEDLGMATMAGIMLVLTA